MSWSTSELRVRLALWNRFKHFTVRSKAVLLLWIFYVFFSVLCLLCLCARRFICALWSPARKGLTSWLSLLVSNCEFDTLPSVSWVRRGTWFYRFLIFAPILTLLVTYTTLLEISCHCIYRCYLTDLVRSPFYGVVCHRSVSSGESSLKSDL